MTRSSSFSLQAVVFALVSASFTNIYLLQPVLPVLQKEFSVDLVTVSFTVSAVVLGIALANLPFGALADRWPIRRLILLGALAVAGAGLVCVLAGNLWLLIAARFVQGLFIPCLTTCLAAYLAKILPRERLNVVMGSYVSATGIGGMGGRLLGGWIHSPLHWRYAILTAAGLMLVAGLVAWWRLPRESAPAGPAPAETVSFGRIFRRWDLVRIFLCTAGGMGVFSSIFNYLPFRLTGEPFGLNTQSITALYLVYLTGIFLGPFAGRAANCFGGGVTILVGSGLVGGSLALLWLPRLTAVGLGLVGVCAGFFTIHTAAVGSLNRRLTSGQGRANAVYVLCY